jgi:hypothetical protein
MGGHQVDITVAVPVGKRCAHRGVVPRRGAVDLGADEVPPMLRRLLDETAGPFVDVQAVGLFADASDEQRSRSSSPSTSAQTDAAEPSDALPPDIAVHAA